MNATSKDLRICRQGDKYYKSSDCPVCPVCENERKPAADFLGNIAAPARRAPGRGINTLVKLSKFTEADLLALHGVGPGLIPGLKMVLKEKGLVLRKK